jgi:hypothetical protein
MLARPGLLPRALSGSLVPARLWLALAAGLGCAVCAYAGLYPQFDDGKLRLVLGLTSAPFAAAVVAYALSARTAARAFGSTVLVAAILGVASTVVPAVVLTWDHHEQLFFACFFGIPCGAATGVVYGLPLAVLSSLGHRHVRAQTHEGTDRATRLAGAWLVVVAAIGIAGTRILDQPTTPYDTDTPTQPSPLPALAGCAAVLAGALSILLGSLRASRRAAWLTRVRSGLEPRFRLRPIDARDRVDALPRLGNGVTVVELRADAVSVTTAGSAYRVSATGSALAIVDDDMCTMSSFTVAPAATSPSATSG